MFAAESIPGASDAPSAFAELDKQQWPHVRQASWKNAADGDPDRARRDARQVALSAQLAFRSAILDVSTSTRRISGELSRYKTRTPDIAGGTTVFIDYVDYGVAQLRWIDTQLAAATRLANTAAEVEDMQFALLCLAGPRLKAAMMGSLLLAVWMDLLQLTDTVRTQHLYSLERMFADMWRWQEMIKPAMTALSSMEPVQVEAVTQDAPALGAEDVSKALVLKDTIEALTMLSSLKFSMPSTPPSSPILLGVGLLSLNPRRSV